MGADPHADIDLKLAQFDGICAFCGKPTKAGRSYTWLKSTRRFKTKTGGSTERSRRVGHIECYDGAHHHLSHYSRR